MTLRVFDYQNAAEFLTDAWREKKLGNPAFSLRAWSRKLGLKSNAPLSLMLRGKRPIPLKYLSYFSRDLGLSARESQYLESLVCLSHARSVEHKAFYLEKLESMFFGNRIRFVEFDQFKVVRDPICMALLEMTELDGFRSDPKWIRERLKKKVSTTEIEERLNRLISVGLLARSASGELKKTHRHLSSSPDVADRAVQDFHVSACELAKAAVSDVAVLEREFNSYAFNVRTKDLPKLKFALRQIIQEIFKEYEAPPGKGDATYQINSQLFPMAISKVQVKEKS